MFWRYIYVLFWIDDLRFAAGNAVRLLVFCFSLDLRQSFRCGFEFAIYMIEILAIFFFFLAKA